MFIRLERLFMSMECQALRCRPPYFMRRLAFITAASLAFAVIPNPATADTGSVQESGALERSIKDDVRFKWNIQGQTQGAGVPNSTGIGTFRPFSIKENSLWFLDSQLNANFGDFDGSSIVNTDVAGTSLSTSTRLGYRWLNDDRSWMYGVNAGYDSRNMNTGDADNATVTDKRDVTFQQVAFGLEAVNEEWNLNAYALIPTGDTEKKLNDTYEGGALDTYGLDVGFDFTDKLSSSIGYYYQEGDLDKADGSGIKGRLAYDLGNGLTVGANLSYDDAFDTRLSGDFKYNFGRNNGGRGNQKPSVIETLSASPINRDVRVHDGICMAGWPISYPVPCS